LTAAAPQALDASSTTIVLFGIVLALVLLCAGVGLNAWLRVRRIDRAEAGQAENDGAEPVATRAPAAAAAPPADDLPEDPDYQGPGDWDGGPLDPPEYRAPST